MRRLRLGVLGCADFAWKRALPALAAVPEVEVAAVASRSPEKAAKFAASFGGEPVSGYERLLERRDVDAVYVPLPPALHEEWVVKAVEAGKHVLVEKPFALSAVSAGLMVDAARRNKRLLMENFAFRLHSHTLAVLEMLRRGDAGEVRLVRAAFGYPPRPEGDVRYDKALGGGAFLDCGVYGVQAALLLLGAGWKALGCQLRMDRARGVDVGGAAMLGFPGGRTAQIAFGFDNVYQCRLSVWGSAAKITMERAFSAPADLETTVWVERQAGREERRFPAEDQLAKLFRAFAGAAASGAGFEPEYARVVEQARAVEAVMRSATLL